MESLDWSGRFGARTVQTIAGNFRSLVDFRAADLDGDGAFDFLYADEEGIWVCWGTCNGAVRDPELVLPRHGLITQIAFEEAESDSPYPSVLWLRLKQNAQGDRLEAYRFNGREPIRFREINEEITGGMRCTGHGLLFGAGGSGDVLLERNGALVRLLSVGETTSDMDFEDVNGDGLMDLLVLANGRLGVAFGQAGDAFAPMSWLPTTESIAAWDVQRDVFGAHGLLIGKQIDRGLDRWVWKSGKWMRYEIRSQHAGRLINHHSTQFDGAALLHQPVRHLVRFIVYAADGEEASSYSLTEIPPEGIVQISDFNGDGLDDVVAFDPTERKLHVIQCHGGPDPVEKRWSRQALEVLEPLDDLPFALPAPMPVEWIQGQSWTGERDWLIAESGIWSLQDDSVSVRRHHLPIADEPTEAVFRDQEPCLHVEYLIYDPTLDAPCLPMDLTRDWHRMTYSRGPLGETCIAVDGQLVFDGYSESNHYDHRMVQLGADFGLSWRGYLDGELDEFKLYTGHIGKDSLLQLHGDADGNKGLPLIGTVTLDGEEPQFAHPSYEEITWEGGAELVASPWGRGLRFDGKTGRAFAFLDIPEDALTFDVRFKFNSIPDRWSTVVGLYGMYNLNSRIRMGVPVEPVAYSPSRFVREQFADNWGGHLLVYGGNIRRALPNGEVLRLEGGRWELMPSEELPRGWSEVAPWTQAGKMWGVFGGSGVWRCDADAVRWEEVGRLKPYLREMDHVVSTGSAAFVWSDDGGLFGWLDAQSNAFFPASSVEKPERVLAARPGLGGVELLEADGRWLHVPYPSPNVEPKEAFVVYNPWWIMAGVSGVGLVFGLGTLLWKKRLKPKGEPLEVPEAVRRNMALLAPYVGKQIEVHELDQVLGFGELETDETRRSRRSRSINELNAWSKEVVGVELIERQRDPLDRRRSIYVVRDELSEFLA